MDGECGLCGWGEECRVVWVGVNGDGGRFGMGKIYIRKRKKSPKIPQQAV
jgi:hypothetical protein